MMDPEDRKKSEEISDDDNDIFSSLPDVADDLGEDEFSAEDLGTGEGEGAFEDVQATEEAAADEEGEGVEEKAADATAEPPKAEADTQTEAPKEEAKAEEVTKGEPKPQEPDTPPEDLQAQYQEFISKSIEGLENGVYKLTDEQKEQLDTAPSEVLPKLAATVHMQVLTQAATYMANMLPQMIPMVMEREGQDRQAEEKFFESFPQLKNHRDDVFRVAKAYRQANPNVTGEQAIQEIGTMAMVALRLPVPGAQPAAEAVAPQQPVVPTSAQGGPAPRPAPRQGNVFSELIDLEED